MQESHSIDGSRASTGRRASVISGDVVRLQSHDDLPLAQRGGQAGCGTESAAREAGDGSATQFDATPGATGVSLGQWSRSAPVWPGLWIVGAVGGDRADRAQIRHSAWCDGGGRTARQVGTDTAKAAAARLPA